METFTRLIFAPLCRASVLSNSFLISDNIFSSLNRTLCWNPKYVEKFWLYMEIHGNIYKAYFRKGMRAIFQKKEKERQRRAKYLKILAKTYKIWKYFEKGQPHVCDSHTHETARICLNIEIYRILNIWKGRCSSQSSTSLKNYQRASLVLATLCSRRIYTAFDKNFFWKKLLRAASKSRAQFCIRVTSTLTKNESNMRQCNLLQCHLRRSLTTTQMNNLRGLQYVVFNVVHIY